MISLKNYLVISTEKLNILEDLYHQHQLLQQSAQKLIRLYQRNYLLWRLNLLRLSKRLLILYSFMLKVIFGIFIKMCLHLFRTVILISKLNRYGLPKLQLNSKKTERRWLIHHDINILILELLNNCLINLMLLALATTKEVIYSKWINGIKLMDFDGVFNMD